MTGSKRAASVVGGIVILLTGSVERSYAQQWQPVTLHQRALGVAALPTDSIPRSTRPQTAPVVVARASSGAVLGLVTAIGGFVAWYGIVQERECRGQPSGFCGIDADRATPAFIVGSIPGIALGASWPRLSSPCAFGRRLQHAAAGAAIGALLGGAITAAGQPEMQLVTAGGAGLVGAINGIGRCR